MKRTKTWAEVDPKVIRKAIELIGGDGHTIWAPEPFVEAGVPADVLSYHIRKFESDTSSPKSTIFKNDGGIGDIEGGIYGLEVSNWIVNDLALSTKGFMGRGYQARENYRAIDEWLNAHGAPKQEESI